MIENKTKQPLENERMIAGKIAGKDKEPTTSGYETSRWLRMVTRR